MISKCYLPSLQMYLEQSLEETEKLLLKMLGEQEEEQTADEEKKE